MSIKAKSTEEKVIATEEEATTTPAEVQQEEAKKESFVKKAWGKAKEFYTKHETGFKIAGGMLAGSLATVAASMLMEDHEEEDVIDVDYTVTPEVAYEEPVALPEPADEVVATSEAE